MNVILQIEKVTGDDVEVRLVHPLAEKDIKYSVEVVHVTDPRPPPMPAKALKLEEESVMHARRLYAHRGASAERPENTMPAFERAIELGVDALEMDVHLTRDGQLIVAHDDTARAWPARRSRGPTLDLADAQRLDAGWGFVATDGTRPFAGKGISVPTFEDVLARSRRAQSTSISRASARSTPMLELLRASTRRGSRHARELPDVDAGRGAPRAATPARPALSQGEVATLFAMPALLWRQLPFTGNAAQVPTQPGPAALRSHAVHREVPQPRPARRLLDDRRRARKQQRLLELGADGIMTNDPAAHRPVFA